MKVGKDSYHSEGIFHSSDKKHTYLIIRDEIPAKCGSRACDIDIFDMTNGKKKKVSTFSAGNYFYHLVCLKRDAIIYLIDARQEDRQTVYGKLYLDMPEQKTKWYRIPFENPDLIDIGPNQYWDKSELTKCD